MQIICGESKNDFLLFDRQHLLWKYNEWRAQELSHNTGRYYPRELLI